MVVPVPLVRSILLAVRSTLEKIGNPDQAPAGTEWISTDIPVVKIQQTNRPSETQTPAIHIYPIGENNTRVASSGNQNVVRGNLTIAMVGYVDTFDPLVVEDWIHDVRNALGNDRDLQGTCVDSTISTAMRAFEGDQLPEASFLINLQVHYRFYEASPAEAI